MNLPDKKYSIIYADPPWKYRDKRAGRGGAENHYCTMPMKELADLPIEKIANDDCVLLMWCTWPLLRMKPISPFDIMEAWGFGYKTLGFEWVKTNKLSEVNQSMMFAEDAFDLSEETFMGCGSYSRSNSEPCLLATRGKPMTFSRSEHSLIYHPIMRHSEKPMEARCRIVRLFGDVPRIELFARTKTPGWDVWGNEV